MTNARVPPQATALIKEFEGCRLKAYRCPAGVWTVGYGHTGRDVYKGLTIAQKQAEQLLQRDLESVAESVDRLVTRPLSDNQLSALISFVFNVGVGNFARSTLLRLINLGVDPSGQFMKWNRAGGRVLAGLTRRRRAERDLWLT